MRRSSEKPMANSSSDAFPERAGPLCSAAMSDLPRIAALPPGPFARLATLLGDVKPGKDPISLAIGDPSGTVPDFVRDALATNAASFGNYPAIAGTQDWRNAAGEWLNRRFALNGAIDP